MFFLVAGCSPLVKQEQPLITAALPVSPDSSAGQTFLARYDGLQSVALNLDTQEQGTGEISLTLYDSPLGGQVVGTAALPVENIDHAGNYRFNFPPIENSSRQDYYFDLELNGTGSYPVAIAPGYSYSSGSAYQDGHPVEDTQLTFRLVYDQRLAALGLLREAAFWLGLLASGFVLFVLPGWALLAGLYPKWDQLRWPERLGLAAGTSLALYPLIYLYTHLIGLHLGAIYAWLPPLLAGGYLILRYFRRVDGKLNLLERLQLPSAADLAYLALVGLLFASRFWSVRTLPIPMWGDSYHHTLIARLLVDHGGLFSSWAPYADMQTFTYHFGFHTLTAALHYLTGLDLPAATLWTGQLVNGLAVLCLYPLATRLGRSPWAGVVAVLLAGLLLPMPMHYVNWGRYTQLAGQVILVAAVYLLWDTLEQEKGWRLPVLASLVLAGLALTHLRVAIIAGLFLLAFWIIYLRKPTAERILRRSAAIFMLAGLLYLPWLARVFSGRILDIFSATLSASATEAASRLTFGEVVGDVFAYLPALAWLCLPVVVGWGLWRRERGVLLVSLWWGLVWIAGEPTWFGLPGKGAITGFAVLIAAYIPASVFFGAAAGWGMEAVERAAPGVEAQDTRPRVKRLIRYLSPILAAAVVLTGIWGARQRLNDVDIASHALVLTPDLRAFDWIEEELPAEARFLVNAHLAFYDTASVGTDGGWWLPLLAGRQTTIPPMNYSFEQEPWPGYRERINDLYKQIQAKGITHPDVLQELRQRGVTHVYIGQQQGKVSFFGQFNFDMQALESSPYFRPVYIQDRVRIYEVLPE